METFERINELLGTDYKSYNDIDWFNISKCQKLSEEFRKEFKDKF